MKNNRLYVIEFASGLVKIGITCNTKARLCAISRDVYPDKILRVAYTNPIQMGAHKAERRLLDRAAEIGNRAFFLTEYFGDLSFCQALCLLKSTAKKAGVDGVCVVNGYTDQVGDSRRLHVARHEWMRSKVKAMRGPYVMPQKQQLNLGSVILSSASDGLNVRVFVPSTGAEVLVSLKQLENWAVRQLREAIK